MATETPSVAKESSTKSPIISATLSWFIPGLGHYYGGKSQRGMYWFLGTVAWYIVMFIGFLLIFGWIMMFITPLVHIAAGADAYFQVKK